MALSKSHPSTDRRFPEGFAKVTLRLAREPGHPQGSQEHGYDLVMPLDKNGQIDSELWKSHRDLCRVVHYGSGEAHEIGHMIRMPGGHWKIHYDVSGHAEDAEGYHFSAERFVVGEYISIIEDDTPHTYRVVTVESL